MAESNQISDQFSIIEQLTEAVEQGSLGAALKLLEEMHPSEIADVLESLPRERRQAIWQLIDQNDKGDVLVELNEEVRGGIVKTIDSAELLTFARHLETDDLADLVQDLPGSEVSQILRSMDKQDRRRLEEVLYYPEDTAGGLMNVDTVTVRPDVTLDVVLRYLRLRGEIPALTDSLIVVDRQDQYLGILPLSLILTRNTDSLVSHVMLTDTKAITFDLPAVDVATRFEHRDLVSAPVVNELGKLLGRITVDDVVDVIRDTAEHSFMSMAGLDEEDDIFAPVVVSARRRAVWLGINLFTAFLASWVIGRFEFALEQVVALAVLMPIVASMGGVAGTQTLTIVTRGLALRQIGSTNARTLMAKELAIGTLNGIMWALVVAFIAAFWFQNYQLGIVIGAALVINLTCAALAGVSIPILLEKIGIDPALAGSVVLTTITDVIGFLSFLGLGAMVLL